MIKNHLFIYDAEFETSTGTETDTAAVETEVTEPTTTVEEPVVTEPVTTEDPIVEDTAQIEFVSADASSVEESPAILGEQDSLIGSPLIIVDETPDVPIITEQSVAEHLADTEIPHIEREEAAVGATLSNVPADSTPAVGSIGLVYDFTEDLTLEEIICKGISEERSDELIEVGVEIAKSISSGTDERTSSLFEQAKITDIKEAALLMLLLGTLLESGNNLTGETPEERGLVLSENAIAKIWAREEVTIRELLKSNNDKLSHKIKDAHYALLNGLPNTFAVTINSICKTPNDFFLAGFATGYNSHLDDKKVTITKKVINWFKGLFGK